MIVSHAHRFIFLKTRKTAGTSVEIALSTVAGADDVITPVSPTDEELRLSVGGRGPQNNESPPLRRKAFNHMPAKMTRNLVGADVWGRYRKLAIERNPWDAVVSLYFWRFRNEEAPPFGEFVQRPLIEKLALQNAQTYRIDGAIAVDRVLRYESLAEDFGAVWAELSLPGEPELPRAKGGARPARAPYQSMYDDAARERVGSVFAAAIADFGYTF